MNKLFYDIRTGFFYQAILLGLLTLASCGGQQQEAPRDPNIIYIIADDLGYADLSVYGQKQFETPHLDKLAAQGMRFTQHYAGSTVCAPSRAVLMTGLHTGHAPVRGNKEIQPEGQQPIASQVYTMAEMLQQAGYVTGAYGKWGLGSPGSEGDPNMQGFDEFYGYNCQRYAHRYYPEHLWSNQKKIDLENDGVKQVEYAPDLIQEETLKFLENYQDSSFFLFMPVVIPHAELVVPDDTLMANFKGKYEETPWLNGKNYGDNFDIAGYASQENPRAAFAAMVTRLDNYVGEVMAKLDELGIADNTIIMFTSDNGPHLEGGADPDFFDSNGVFRGHKRDLYEGGIRVPMIVRWPEKVPAGTTSDHISAFWDVMPTVAEVANTKAPADIDGISFLPALTRNGEQTRHDYLYWEFHEQGGKQAVRKGKWKGVRLGVRENADAPIELYDLEADPGEQNNVAEAHPEMVEEMDRLMKQAHQSNPDFPFLPKEQENS